ncbi:hypothetical protein ACOSP7_016011 [Xanthoceras sorbifolium]
MKTWSGNLILAKGNRYDHETISHLILAKEMKWYIHQSKRSNCSTIYNQNFPNIMSGQNASYLHTIVTFYKSRIDSYKKQHLYDTRMPTKILIIYIYIYISPSHKRTSCPL